MAWLLSILYGLVSGLTEFFPVSAAAHQALLGRIFSSQSPSPLLLPAAHLGCLLGVLYCTRARRLRMKKAQRSRSSRRHHRQQTEMQNLLTSKMLRTAFYPMALGLLCTVVARPLENRLNFVAVFLIVNGIVLFLPQIVSSGNRDERTGNRLDAAVMGMCAAASVLPGISRMGMVTGVASLQGFGKKFALEFSLLLSVSALTLTLVMDGVGLFLGGSLGFGLAVAVQCILCALTAFLGSLLSISLMRFLSERAGFSGFCYYCWGAALYCFILFMTI